MIKISLPEIEDIMMLKVNSGIQLEYWHIWWHKVVENKYSLLRVDGIKLVAQAAMKIKIRIVLPRFNIQLPTDMYKSWCPYKTKIYYTLSNFKIITEMFMSLDFGLSLRLVMTKIG